MTPAIEAVKKLAWPVGGGGDSGLQNLGAKGDVYESVIERHTEDFYSCHKDNHILAVLACLAARRPSKRISPRMGKLAGTSLFPRRKAC